MQIFERKNADNLVFTFLAPMIYAKDIYVLATPSGEMKKSRKTAALKEQRPFALLAKSRKKKAYRPAKLLAVYSRHRYHTKRNKPASRSATSACGRVCLLVM